MNEKLDFLMSVLDFHIENGENPTRAWISALNGYALVYHPKDGDEGTPLSRAAERVLDHLKGEDPLPEPMRKYVNYEQLKVPHFVITDTVKALAGSNNELAAIKLIRGSFLEKDGLFCSLTMAKAIFDIIMARR